jgi:hypothetical protein
MWAIVGPMGGQGKFVTAAEAAENKSLLLLFSRKEGLSYFGVVPLR